MACRVPLHGLLNGRCSCGEESCGTTGKHPRLRAWQVRASVDPHLLEGWFRRWPHANVGIATGRRSGLVALDVDPRNGGEETLAALQERHGPLPVTVESRT